MASLFFSVNPDYRPSSPTLLPQGEKGANHIAPHRHPTVGCNKRSAVHRDHMADLPPHPPPFSREGRRGQTTVAICCKRCNSLRSLHPTHAAFSKVTNPPGGFVTSDERHSSTAIPALSPNQIKIFIHLKTVTYGRFSNKNHSGPYFANLPLLSPFATRQGRL